MPGAIADSSVVMNLGGIGRLELLRDFHRPLFVTPAVVREVVEEGRGKPGAAELEAAIEEGWITVKEPNDEALVATLMMDLGDGEAECIALAVEMSDKLVLVDDDEARSRARALNLRRAGVLGVLMLAKREGIITSLAVELKRLREEMGFWLADDVVSRALEEAGEDPIHE